MSVLIKGMEMPITCCRCRMMVYNPEIVWNGDLGEQHGGWVCLLTAELVDNTKREEHCPLVEVPPHGRLVDADDFYEKTHALLMQYAGKGSLNSIDVFEVNGLLTHLFRLLNAPTVIEADPAEEGE